jgi:hypothetical protein
MRWLVLLALTGCAKDITADVERLAERACECRDKRDAACGRQVLGDLGTLVAESRNVKGDERRAAEGAKRLGECLLAAGVTSMEIAQKINLDPTAEAAAAERASE